MLIDPVRPPAASRVLGVDPGAPFAHFAIVSRPADGDPPRVEDYGSIEWRGKREAWAGIKALVARVDLVVCEAQFLNPGYFAQEGRNPASAGSYFGSLVELAHVCSAFGCASEEVLGAPAVSVMPGPWRRLLAPLPRRSRDDARAASLDLVRAMGVPGPGARPKGAWPKSSHDLAAAICIGLWGLGYTRGEECAPGAWPPSK